MLAKNLIITGIPNNDIVWGDDTYSDNTEKVVVILGAINASLEDGSYVLKIFDSLPERQTFSAKLIFNDTATKNMVLGKAKQLRDCECDQLKRVYIKNDETKQASKENYRLRQKRRALKGDNPDAVLKIEKGKLTHDGVW